jgi:hypothetical protein
MPKKVSLGSVVRQKGERRYMGVRSLSADGLTVVCAWLESGKVLRTGTFAIEDIEVVPAMGADEFLWREAFRAAGSRE